MNNTCKKRILREINYIKDNMPEYTIVDEIEENKLKKEMSIHITSPNYNNFIFRLPYDYPFKPPTKLSCNGENYRYSLKNMPTRIYYLYYHPEQMYFQEKLETINYNRRDCLCCNTLLCSANWTPVNMLHHILKEIKDHNILKKNIMYKLTLKNVFDYFDLPLELMRNVYNFL